MSSIDALTPRNSKRERDLYVIALRLFYSREGINISRHVLCNGYIQCLEGLIIAFQLDPLWKNNLLNKPFFRWSKYSFVLLNIK